MILVPGGEGGPQSEGLPEVSVCVEDPQHGGGAGLPAGGVAGPADEGQHRAGLLAGRHRSPGLGPVVWPPCRPESPRARLRPRTVWSDGPQVSLPGPPHHD